MNQKQTFTYPEPNPDLNRYPFCIVWTLLPCISWFLPWIGHTGICEYDFIYGQLRRLPYQCTAFPIQKRQMAFGNPKKYVQLNIPQTDMQSIFYPNYKKMVFFPVGIQAKADGGQKCAYRHIVIGKPSVRPIKLTAIQQQENNLTKHDLCCNNCHHHVAYVLNLVAYRGRTDWTQVSIWWMCLAQSKYVAWWSPFLIYLPFLVILAAIVLAVTLVKQ